MAYIGHVSNVLDGFGCGKTCGCSSCRSATTLSEWYIEDDDDDENDNEDKDDDPKEPDLLSGALTPEEMALERRIAHARELWRPVVQGGPQRYVNHQLGAFSGPMGLAVHPVDLASAQHLGWVGLTAPPGTLGARLVGAIAMCLRDLGEPNVAGRAGAMAACLAGFLAGPSAAPIVWTCLKAIGIVLSLAFVSRLLVCVAAKMTARPVPATA